MCNINRKGSPCCHATREFGLTEFRRGAEVDIVLSGQGAGSPRQCGGRVLDEGLVARAGGVRSKQSCKRSYLSLRQGMIVDVHISDHAYEIPRVIVGTTPDANVRAFRKFIGIVATGEIDTFFAVCVDLGHIRPQVGTLSHGQSTMVPFTVVYNGSASEITGLVLGP